MAGICSKFHIDKHSYLKLLKVYQIDPPRLYPEGRGRGFASMDKDRMFRVASAGGKAAHAKGTAHKWTREEARRAGKIGGMKPKVFNYK
jgi:general stress protein YciG